MTQGKGKPKGKGKSRRRGKVQLAADRQAIASMYLRGKAQVDIAAELGLSQPTVSRDLKIIQGEWLDSAIRDFDAARAQELAKIDELERTYWAAWERSFNKRIESQQIIAEMIGDADAQPKKVIKNQEQLIGRGATADTGATGAAGSVSQQSG